MLGAPLGLWSFHLRYGSVLFRCVLFNVLLVRVDTHALVIFILNGFFLRYFLLCTVVFPRLELRRTPPLSGGAPLVFSRLIIGYRWGFVFRDYLPLFRFLFP